MSNPADSNLVRPLPDGMSVMVWGPNWGPPAIKLGHGEISELDQRVVWIDVPVDGDFDAIAEAIGEMHLVFWVQGFLPFVMSGSDERLARSFPFYDKSLEELRKGRLTHTLTQFVVAPALTADVDPGPSEPPWVYSGDVAILACPNWVMTGRRPQTATMGTGEIAMGSPYTFGRLYEYVYSHRQRFEAGPQLALLILRATVDTYAEALAALSRRLSDLQQGYIRGVVDQELPETIDDRDYRAGLLQVKWVVDGLARRLIELIRPDLESWFWVDSTTMPVAKEIERLLERAETTLKELRSEVTESFALASSTQTSRQLELATRAQQTAERAAAQRERFNRVATVFATILVGPGLVVGAFSALPEIWAAHWGLRLVTMTVLSIAFAFAVYKALTLAGRPHAEKPNQLPASHPATDDSPAVRPPAADDQDRDEPDRDG